MVVVRIAIGCAVAALLVGGGLSNLTPEARQALLTSARATVGGPVMAPTSASTPLRPIQTVPAPAQISGGEIIAPDRHGQYQTAVEIEGELVPVLIDTGATFVALSFEDADRLGIRPLPADFRMPMNTANGRAFAAPVELRSIRLGAIEVRDVPAIVAGRGQMNGTLLGMSFLSRLSGVAVDHGELVLRQ